MDISKFIPVGVSIGSVIPLEGAQPTDEEKNELVAQLQSMVGYFVNGFSYSVTFQDGTITNLTVTKNANYEGFEIPEDAIKVESMYGQSVLAATVDFNDGLPLDDTAKYHLMSQENINVDGAIFVDLGTEDIAHEIVENLLKKAWYRYALVQETEIYSYPREIDGQSETQTIEGKGYLTEISNVSIVRGNADGELRLVLIPTVSLSNYIDTSDDRLREWYRWNYETSFYLSEVKTYLRYY